MFSETSLDLPCRILPINVLASSCPVYSFKEFAILVVLWQARLYVEAFLARTDINRSPIRIRDTRLSGAIIVASVNVEVVI